MITCVVQVFMGVSMVAAVVVRVTALIVVVWLLRL
jgi:hypothetical protein